MKKALRLKPQYHGVTVSKNVHSIGCNVTFNALMVPPDAYKNYYDLGFEFLFDIIEEEKKTKIKVSSK